MKFGEGKIDQTPSGDQISKDRENLINFRCTLQESTILNKIDILYGTDQPSSSSTGEEYFKENAQAILDELQNLRGCVEEKVNNKASDGLLTIIKSIEDGVHMKDWDGTARRTVWLKMFTHGLEAGMAIE